MERSAAQPGAGPRYLVVSRSSPLPLYHQVEVDMRQRIESGEWRRGEQIPTEAELCTIYGASRVTIREAVRRLTEEGLLVRRRGSGTFVREARITAGARGLTSFTEEMAALGSRGESRVLSVAVQASSAAISDKLSLRPGAELVTIRRLRLVDGTPMGIQSAHLPADRFPGLDKVELGTGSLYAMLADHYGVVPVEAEETFEVAPIRAGDARLLQVASGSCGFRVGRLTFDEHGAFEFVTSIMRGDRYQVRIGLRVQQLPTGSRTGVRP
jgi:GntR family transcriptional regulator